MSTGHWLLVAGAGVPLAAAIGALLTWSLWRDPAASPRFVPALLALHTGLVVVAGTVATAAAVRTWQLVGRDEEQASGALLQVSTIDADRSFYALAVLVLVAATALLAILLALAARFASSSHPVDRAIACAVIGVEIGASGIGLAYLAGGSRSLLTLAAVAHLPVLVAAMVACWPPHPEAEAPRPVAPRRIRAR